MNQPNLPAWLQTAPPSRLADTLGQNLGGGAPPHISLENDRFTLIDASGDSEPILTADPKTGFPYFDCCIADVGDHASKIWYEKKFVKGSSAPPDCWSDNGIAPSINAGLPQARTCTPDPTNTHGCAKAVWGSKTSEVTGKGVPACGKYQKLAVILPGDDVLFLLRVPPNSLDNLRTYNAKFKGQPIGPEGVITRITFEAGKQLNFTAISYVDEDTWKRRQAALAAQVTDTLVGRGDVPRTAALPAPSGASLPAQDVAPLPPGQGTQGAVYAIPGQGTQGAVYATPAQIQQLSPPTSGPTTKLAGTQPPARRRGPAANPSPGGQPAPFRTAEPVQAAQPVVGIAAQPTAPFGIATGVAPNPEVAAAINSIFGPR